MRTVRLTMLSLALLGSALAAAPAAAESKIGAIRTPVLWREAPQIKAADNKIKAEFAQREKDLETEGKKIQDDYKKFQREADTMAAGQRATAEKDLTTRKIDFDAKQRTFAEQAQQRNNELRREIVDQINKAIADVAKERGYDLVIQDPAFLNDSIDITDEVLKRLAALPASAPAKAKKK